MSDDRQYGLASRLRAAWGAFTETPEPTPQSAGDALFMGKVRVQKIGVQFKCWSEAHEIWRMGLRAGRLATLESMGTHMAEMEENIRNAER